MTIDKSQLVSHGFVKGRELVLDILEHALAGVDPRRAVLEYVRVEGDTLHVGDETYDLRGVGDIYAIGAGKATYPLAVALDEILEDRITDGFVAAKTGQVGPLSQVMGVPRRIRVAESAHPVPDASSLEAGKEVLAIADRAKKGDLVFCLMSGGVSAQCICPVSGISLEDKSAVNRLLVRSGAEVTEIMSVRRHLSQIKGGQLASRMHPATMIALTVSDEKNDVMEWNTDWTSPDSSTLADSIRILRKYALWERVPESVRRYLSEAGPDQETPKNLDGMDVHNHMVVRTRTLWESAVRRARELGLTPLMLTSLLSGESREVGRTLSSIAREVRVSGNPVEAPCALIAIGETAVRITEEPRGEGGANQELAAGACLDLKPDDPIVICALDTDGTDGPTSLAGALTDGTTPVRVAEHGMDLYEMLTAHDVSRALRAAGDAVETGPTGTNVNDIVVAVVL